MNDLVLLDLQTDISVGNITTNAALLLEAVKKGVEKYHEPNYIPSEVIAKADRAELNRAEKLVAEKAKAVKDAWNQPLEVFNGLVAEIRNTIKEAAGVVDGSVKAFEEKQKTAKREEIQKYFDNKKFELVPLDRIFDQRWLNKTKNIKEVREELDEKITAIYRDVEILEKIPEHGMAAKAFYLDVLDIGAALRQVEVLKENAVKAAREQANREQRKIQEQCEQNDKVERQEKVNAFKQERAQNLIDQAFDLPEGTTAAQVKAEIIECTLTFEGTKEQLLKLRQYMTENGIAYRKALVLDSDNDARQVAKSKNIAEDIHTLLYVPNAA